ncbi:hypothetical protein HGB07_07825 [Candidatus Roizmanbacteria bacterium]|jgi:hypothetical protein|nr:hypothetical protein [Candidatus Roizmanbacteria bacterium]
MKYKKDKINPFIILKSTLDVENLQSKLSWLTILGRTHHHLRQKNFPITTDDKAEHDDRIGEENEKLL